MPPVTGMIRLPLALQGERRECQRAVSEGVAGRKRSHSNKLPLALWRPVGASRISHGQNFPEPPWGGKKRGSTEGPELGSGVPTTS